MPKLLRPLDGRPLVSFALEAMLGLGAPVAVVQGATDLRDVCPPGVVVLENPEWRGGLASSLRCGLAWASALGATAAVVGLADAPGIPAAAWRRVATSAPDAEVVVASFAGRRHPPVRLAAAVFAAVPAAGDVGARGLFDRPGTVAIECPGDPHDVDTPDDLVAWQARGVPQ